MRWSVAVWVIAFLSLAPSSLPLCPSPGFMLLPFRTTTASGLRCRRPRGSSLRWGRRPCMSVSQQREFSFPLVILLPFYMAHVGILLLCICINVCVHTHILHTCTYTHTCAHTYYTHAHTHILHTLLHTCMYTHILYTHTTHMHVHTHIYYTHTHTYTLHTCKKFFSDVHLHT